MIELSIITCPHKSGNLCHLSLNVSVIRSSALVPCSLLYRVLLWDLACKEPGTQAEQFHVPFNRLLKSCGFCDEALSLSPPTIAMGHAMGTLGSPKISFPSRPACVPLRQPAAPEKISLSTLLDIYCPSLLSEFRPAWWLFKRVHALSFSCCYALTQRSGHLQTLYASLGDFSAVDQISYDRWVIFQHHAVHVLRCTATGGYFGSRTVGPCQAIRSNAEELRSLSQQGSGFHTDCFRSCPPRRNANHCSFARPKWWFVHTPQCC